MNPTNIKWNRTGFDSAIGAKVKTMGTYPKNSVSYIIHDDNGISANMLIGPYTKTVHIEIYGPTNSLITYIDLFDVNAIQYIKYDNNNGDIVHEIAFGPALFKKDGQELYYVFVSNIPSIGLWICEKNDHDLTINDFPYEILY